MKACFFSRVKDKYLFEIVDFYRNDIRILKEMGFDVVLANNFYDIPFDCDLYFSWFPGFAILPQIKSKLARKPNILISPLHYYDKRIGYLSKPLYKRLIIRLSMQLADRNLAISKINLDGLKALEVHNALMVYLGVDTDFYHPSPLPCTERHLVLSIAHLNKWSIARKKLKLVIQAIPFVVKRFPRVHFTMAGSKEDGFEELEKLAKKLDVQDVIEFPGRISLQEKLKLFSKAKVFVQPSIVEGFGMAQAEAMSCGVPVITNNVGSLPELIGDCGMYLSNDDPIELSKLICNFFENRTLWSNLSRNGRKRIINNFSYKLRKEKIATIIKEVLAERQ